MGKIYLLSCSKTKQSEPAQAQDMYVSTLFRLMKEAVAGNQWYILSGKYGLLEPTTVIEPYDVSVNRMTWAENLEWSWRVFAALEEIHQGETIVFLAGKSYRRCLEPILIERGIMTEVPMRTLGIGQQQAFLKQGKLG